ncbi:MAG: glycosyltransferase family 2 protein [Pseudomonadota bacterium]
MTATRIDILLCTFRRPEVARTLASLGALTIPEGVAVRVIVSDNDDTPSAEARVTEAAATLSFPLLYLHAPARNISIARNACLDAATAAWVAFLDDDEFADPAWLTELYARAAQTGADGLFGPALAEYGSDAPTWMRGRDYHSNIPERRGDRVETGHTCNAFLRWAGTPWQYERFALDRGRSGGEDTEFFFRLGRLGAQFEICDTAIVTEPVAESRLSFRWLRDRKFRMGQSYAAAATTPAARLTLGLSALAKAGICGLAVLAYLPLQARRNFWALRGALHVGVCAGCLSLRQAEHYG